MVTLVATLLHVFVGILASRVSFILSQAIWRRYMDFQLVSAQPRSIYCMRTRFLAIVVCLRGQGVLWLPTTCAWGLYRAEAADARQAVHNLVCDAVGSCSHFSTTTGSFGAHVTVLPGSLIVRFAARCGASTRWLWRALGSVEVIFVVDFSLVMCLIYLKVAPCAAQSSGGV